MSDKTAVRAQLESYGQMTPSQVALALAALSRALEKMQNDQEPLETDAVEKREAYTLEYATLFLGEEGNNEERKQATLRRTHETRLAAELAETLVKMHIAQVNTLRKRIDIARSAAALVRAEWELQNTNQGHRR